MIIDNGLHHADKVLTALRRILRPRTGQLFIGAYQNGREDGYRVRFYKKSWAGLEPHPTVFFSENRNSDQVVIYITPGYADTLTDEAYENRQHFPGTIQGFKQAASFIAKNL